MVSQRKLKRHQKARKHYNNKNVINDSYSKYMEIYTFMLISLFSREKKKKKKKPSPRISNINEFFFTNMKLFWKC